MEKPNHQLASALFEQVKNEAEARRWYEGLLATYGEQLDPDDIEQINEIQSDETNHLLVLMAMAKKYDGGICASPDGAQAAVSKIITGVGVKDYKPVRG